MDLKHLSLVEMLQTLFDTMRDITEYKGESTILYDNPAAASTTDPKLL